MKRLLTIFALMAVLSACRMNNGDIGNLFGTWSLEEMTCNGTVPDDFVPGQTTWSFQNNIIFIHRLEDHHDYALHVGTWTDDGRTLELNFTHTDDTNGTGRYNAPYWLGFQEDAVENLTWITNESRKLVLTYTNPEKGNIYVYTLLKTY